MEEEVTEAGTRIPIIGWLLVIWLWLWNHKWAVLNSLVGISLFALAVSTSFQAHSAYPFLEQFGGRFSTADTLAGQYSKQIFTNSTVFTKINYIGTSRLLWGDNFVEKITATTNNIGIFFTSSFDRLVTLWLLFSNLYWIGFIIWLVYWAYSTVNMTSKLKNILMAILTVALLEILSNIGFIIAKTFNFPTFYWSLGSIIIAVGLVFLLRFLYNKPESSIMMVIAIIVIIITVIGIVINAYVTNSQIKEVGQAIIPFKGVATFIYYVIERFSGQTTNTVLNNAPSINISH